MNGLSWLILWPSLILGIFFPGFWLVSLFALIGIIIFPRERGYVSSVKPATERDYKENVRFYKKHGIDYDEWMMKLNPHLPIPGKPQ